MIESVSESLFQLSDMDDEDCSEGKSTKLTKAQEGSDVMKNSDSDDDIKFDTMLNWKLDANDHKKLRIRKDMG